MSLCGGAGDTGLEASELWRGDEVEEEMESWWRGDDEAWWRGDRRLAVLRLVSGLGASMLSVIFQS